MSTNESDRQQEQSFEAVLDAAWLFHPENAPENLEYWQEVCSVSDELLSPDAARFKRELRRAIETDMVGLDLVEFDRRSGHTGRTDMLLLRQMWVTFFPRDPIPGRPLEPFDAVRTVARFYYENAIDPDDNAAPPERLKALLALPPADQGALLRAVKVDLVRVIVGAVDDMPTGGLSDVGRLNLPPGDAPVARALWFDLFPDDPIPGEENQGPAGDRSDLWPR